MAEPFPINKVRIDLKDSRDVKALEILAASDTWTEIQNSRLGGAKAYGIPSTSTVDLVYHVDLNECECPDHRFRGQTCAHIRAVRLFTNMIHSHIHRAAVGIEREIRKDRREEPKLTIF